MPTGINIARLSNTELFLAFTDADICFMHPNMSAVDDTFVKSILVYKQIHEILILIAYAQTPHINAHADV